MCLSVSQLVIAVQSHCVKMNSVLVIAILFGFLINHGQTAIGQTKIEISCSTTEDCTKLTENSVCNTVTAKCECPEGTIVSSDLEKCLAIAEGYDSSCDDNTQCSASPLSAGGICSDGKCACDEGYHYLKGNCWKSVGLGGECSQTEQCYQSREYIGFKCENKKCQCREGFYSRLDSACRRIMHQQGDVCYVDEDCQCENSAVGKCSGYKCACSNVQNKEIFSTSSFGNEIEEEVRSTKETCKPGTYPSGGVCKLELGMECTDKCGPTRSSCYENVCTCLMQPNGIITVNWVAGANNRVCLSPIADIQSTAKCTENVQCSIFGDNAICDNSICKCLDSSHWVEEDKFCYKTKNLGEDCKTGKDCYSPDGPTECSTGKCGCAQGYHQNKNDCLKDALHVGDSCLDDSDCLFDNSMCDTKNKICVCKASYFEDKGLCTPGVSSVCTDNSQCSLIENSICNVTSPDSDQKTCNCLDDFVSSGNGEFCLPITQYKGECKETVQCDETLGELKECRSGQCLCEKTAHYSNGKCYETIPLGEKCGNKNECTGGQDFNAVICLNGRCACHYDYVKNSNNKCVKDGSDDSNKDNSGNNLQLSILLMTSLAFLLLFKQI